MSICKGMTGGYSNPIAKTNSNIKYEVYKNGFWIEVSVIMYKSYKGLKRKNK